MSLTITHAIVPIAAMVAVAKRPLPMRLSLAAIMAAMAPDLDGLMHPLFGIARYSIYSHRGFSHSLFVALSFGALAAACHRFLKVPPLLAAVVVAASMASHGLLDMMTDRGKPVAYLWPLSSERMFADWRPFPGTAHAASFLQEVGSRIGPELVRVALPLLVAASLMRGCVIAYTRFARRGLPLRRLRDALG
jgi:inner membrane protein